MKPETRVIVDLSSIGWTCLLAGRDKEFGYEVEFEGKNYFINSADYGFENVMNHLDAVRQRFDLVPKDFIFVMEGMNSKTLRRSMLPTYKADDHRAPEAYEEFNKLKMQVIEAWRSVGACMVTQDGIEADDVIAYLAKNLKGRRIIDTNDGDLAVLVDEANGIEHFKNGEMNLNPFGPFPHKFITLYKATRGDPGDKIPGARGFGEKAFMDMLCIFGEEGLVALEDMIARRALDELQENVPELKSLQKLIDNADMVYTSYACAKLYDEKVNTMRMPLQWKPGMVKAATRDTHEFLRPFTGRVRLIHQHNYVEAKEWMLKHVLTSPFISLDIETSTPPESDEWMANVHNRAVEDVSGVDVFGSKLTGMALTFGNNLQYTFYFTVDHAEEDGILNISSDQALDIVKMIPKSIPLQIQNCSFEFPVLHKEWAHDVEWQNNGWHGFLPNAHDTRIAAKYVNENVSAGLKQSSLLYLGYEQVSYKDLMRFRVLGEQKPFKGGRVIEREEVYRKIEVPYKGKVEALQGTMVEKDDKSSPPAIYTTIEYKMNEVPAKHVLAYGADDTICTAALHVFYRMVMEIENTWDVYLKVEQLAQYLTNLGYLKGVPLSRERLRFLEKEDQEAAAKASEVIKKFLLKSGWEGSTAPVFTEITPATIKEAFAIITGREFECRARLLPKIAKYLEEEGEDLLARFVENENVEGMNKLVARYYKVNPVLDVDSPKQVKKFFYDTLGLPIHLVNKLTPKERETNPELAKAVRKYNKLWSGSDDIVMTKEEQKLLYLKASTDDSVIDFALAWDVEDKPEIKEVLEAVRIVKKASTRQKFYYTPYPLLHHWQDGKMHSAYNQSTTTTLRYTSSGPNMQQLAKRGEGVKVRTAVVPHKRKAVVVSIDFGGQELRLAAHLSQDANMLACYVGENLKDMHAMTASGAMAKRFDKEFIGKIEERYGVKLVKMLKQELYEFFLRLRKDDDKDVKKKADDLRRDCKPVNFGSAYGITAPALAVDMVITAGEAQEFLDAKKAMFPGYDRWVDSVSEKVKRCGYATTLLGARRHLAESIMHPDKWVAEKAMRQASNAEIQSSAAEQTKLALARLWSRDIYYRYDAQFIAPIHDEVVSSISYERSDDDVVNFIREKHACMVAQYANLCVPVVGSISIGPNFGVQIECGDEFDEAAIRKALQEVKAMQAEEWNEREAA